MTLTVDFQNISAATAKSFTAGEFFPPFDCVKVASLNGGYVDLFLPSGTGQAVADAINAAVKPADEVLK